MKALRWIYRRIGQMLCFTLGGAFAFLSLFGLLPAMVMTVAFFALGLFLRQQMLDAPPERDTLAEWWATLTPKQQDYITQYLTRQK